MKTRISRLSIPPIFLIVIAGILLRIIFYQFFAWYYFGVEDFECNGDSTEYILAIRNLIHHGEYTIDFGDDRGYFARSPGYPFFIGLIYLLTGMNLELTKELLPWIQILLDGLNIFLCYRIVDSVQQKKSAIILAMLYAGFPFAILWNPIIQSEILTVTCMLLSINVLMRAKSKRQFFLAGIFCSLAVLTRIQLLLLPIAIILSTAFIRQFRPLRVEAISFLLLGFMICYSPWVLRNLVFHGRLQIGIITYSRHYNDDMIALLKYSSLIQLDANRQVMEIILKQSVEWPPAAHAVKGDSLLLSSTTSLCKECGSSFDSFSGLNAAKANCNDRIKEGFEVLSQHQVKQNFMHSQLKMPMLRLHKAIFKSAMLDQTGINPYFRWLFYYRSFLIIVGFTSSLYMLLFRNQFRLLNSVILCFAILNWIFFAFFHYNLVMRYLLYVDILLLIPVALMAGNILEEGKKTKRSREK